MSLVLEEILVGKGAQGTCLLGVGVAGRNVDKMVLLVGLGVGGDIVTWAC